MPRLDPVIAGWDNERSRQERELSTASDQNRSPVEEGPVVIYPHNTPNTPGEHPPVAI